MCCVRRGGKIYATFAEVLKILTIVPATICGRVTELFVPVTVVKAVTLAVIGAAVPKLLFPVAA